MEFKIVQLSWQLLLSILLIMGPLPVLILLRSHLTSFSIVESVISYMVVWSAVQVVIGQVLGFFGLLTLKSYLIVYLSLVLLMIGGKLICSVGSSLSWQAVWGTTPFQKETSFKIEQILNTKNHRMIRNNKIGVMGRWALVLLGVLTLVLISTVLTQPTTDYDSLWYHLTTLGRWYSTHSTMTMEGWGLPEYYPYNWELLSLLFVLPFQNDYAVTLPNILAWILFGLAFWTIAERLKIPYGYIIGGLGLVLTIPMMTKLINTLHVEIAFTAYFLAGLAFILLYQQTGKIVTLMLLATAIGMQIGIKTSGFLYGAVLLVYFSLTNLINSNRRRFSKTIPVTLAFVGVVILVSASWYVRNYLEAGNPFAPLQLDVLGHVLLPGTITREEIARSTLINSFDFINQQHWSVWLNEARPALGFQTVILLLMSLAGTGALLTRRKDYLHRDKLLVALLSIILISVYWNLPYTGGDGVDRYWLTHPWWISQSIRFFLPALGVLGITAIVGAHSLRIPVNIVIGMGMVGYIETLTHFPSRLFQASLLCSVVVIVVFWLFKNGSVAQFRARYTHMNLVFTLLLMFVLGSFFIAVTQRERTIQRPIVYGGIQDWIDSNITDDDRIGYTLCARSFLLFGTHIDKKVVFISTPSSFTKEAWVEELRNQGITFVAIGPIQPEWTQFSEVLWLEDESYFHKIFGKDSLHQIVLYQLINKQQVFDDNVFVRY